MGPKGRDYSGNFKNCYGSFQSAPNQWSFREQMPVKHNFANRLNRPVYLRYETLGHVK